MLIFKNKEERHRDFRMPPKSPLGVFVFLAFQSDVAIQASCVRLLNTAFPLFNHTVQDQNMGSCLSFDTILPIFCLTVMGNVWKRALCCFEGSPLTDGPVWSSNCCPKLPQMEDAEEKMAAGFEPRALTCAEDNNVFICIFVFTCYHPNMWKRTDGRTVRVTKVVKDHESRSKTTKQTCRHVCRLIRACFSRCAVPHLIGVFISNTSTQLFKWKAHWNLIFSF